MLSGCGIGIVIGLFPGFSVLAAMLILFPFLSSLDAMSILVFYAALMTSAQYCGSITATYFGVPGENTSLVASKIGYRMHTRGCTNLAIGSASVSSFLASAVGLALMWLISQQQQLFSGFYSVKIQLAAMLFVAVFLLIYSGNRIAHNTWMILVGALLGAIGSHPIQAYSLTLQWDLLGPGLSIPLVLTLCFVIPNLLRYQNRGGAITNPATRSIDRYWTALILCWRNRWSALRGSVIGSVIGLMPGVAILASSTSAYGAERRITTRNTAHLMAAEAANNSAVVMCLMPLILFGVPVIASESMVLSLLLQQGVQINLLWMLQSYTADLSHLDILMLTLIPINVLMLIMAWPLSRVLISVYSRIPMWCMTSVIYVVLAAVIVADSLARLSWQTDIASLIVLVPLCWIMIRHRHDGLPLVFSFLLAEHVIGLLVVMSDLYF
jgi:TctA family transporter